jgi:hypothetical protein
MIVACLLAVAAVVVLFPSIVGRVVEATVKPAAPPAKPGVGYQAAIADLASVRRRLVETKMLDDKCRAAVDTLTLGLVAGSDQP